MSRLARSSLVSQFRCSVCAIQKTNVEEFEVHVKLDHLNWLPFECRLCATEWATAVQLRAHLRLFHQVNENNCQFLYKDNVNASRDFAKILIDSEYFTEKLRLKFSIDQLLDLNVQDSNVQADSRSSQSSDDSFKNSSSSVETPCIDISDSPPKDGDSLQDMKQEDRPNFIASALAMPLLRTLLSMGPNSTMTSFSAEKNETSPSPIRNWKRTRSDNDATFPFKILNCKLCGKSINKSQKYQHVRRHHVRVKNFACPNCTYTEYSKSVVNAHIWRMHNGIGNSIVKVPPPGYEDRVEEMQQQCFPSD